MWVRSRVACVCERSANVGTFLADRILFFSLSIVIQSQSHNPDPAAAVGSRPYWMLR
jgi:hypothetical protein